MTTAQRTMTAEDLWRMPSNGQRYELVNGELKTMAPAGFDHGNIGGELFNRLRSHVKERRLGVVVGPDTGFVISRNPDTVRAPDAAFVSQARVDKVGMVKEFFPGAPDLAVEVLSPSDTIYDMDEKVAEYLEAGTRLVWVVNPKRRTVTVHRPNAEPRILRESDELSGVDVVAGFACRIAEIFA